MEKDKLIDKWQERHSKLLADYNDFKKLSELEALFLRSEMKQVLEFIDDLKKEKNMTKQVKFKWWYCVILGFATIIDGLTMALTIGYFATGLALKYSLYGASHNIYRK